MADVDDGRGELAPEPPGEAPPRAPRWVKVLAVGAVFLAALVGVMLLTGGPGEHGPGRHSSGGGDAPAGGTGGQSSSPERHTPPPGAEGHQPPPGGHPPPETTP